MGLYLILYGHHIGALAALIVGLFQERQMWHVGFGVGGLGVLVSLLVYRCTRKNLKRCKVKGIKPEWEVANDQYQHIGRWVGLFVVALVALIR